MSDEETAKEALERILYTKIDAGLYKRDAYEIVEAIDRLIGERNAKLVAALERIIKLNDGQPDSETVWIAEQALAQQSTEKP